ncbi:DUF4199 domain-containing protein [Halosquirtibacter laminarini]|uniref:DUF4199 domain-containing protein n=1 Tax=Halosquirtibacter laminarini TaxID=3374600 RepID=A0AC61NFK9_9BACT|nr:DUF4199 domain-containing protein [Prolixibacteraceae bacterium]
MFATRNNYLYHVMMSGIYLGSALVGVRFVSYLFNAYNSNVFAMILFVVYALGVFRLVKKYREEQLGGYITYWNSVSFIILTSFFASMILGLFSFVYLKFIDTTILTSMINEAESAYVKIFDVLDGSFSDDLQEELIKQVRNITPMDIWKSEMTNYLWGGSLLGLLLSFFVRRVNNDPFHEINS